MLEQKRNLMLEQKRNILQEKAQALNHRIVKLIQYLRSKPVESSWVTQLARCGTSISANIAESKNAQSRADFVSKLNIALKEADETVHWLDTIHIAGGLNEIEHNSILTDVKEIIFLLTAIIKKTKENGL